MKVLHLYRGYRGQGRNSVIEAQIESLIKKIEVIPYPFYQGGIRGYLHSVFTLKKYLKKNHFDLIHAHYSFSGFAASLTFSPRIVCSLMGSDLLQQNIIIKPITFLFSKYSWKMTIVKSQNMKKVLKKAVVIPNGVDFQKFFPIKKEIAIKNTDLNPDFKNIIFVATKDSEPVKNIALAKKAVSLLDGLNVKLTPVTNMAQDKLNFYYNAADLLLLTSLSEGSPNVVKEAMACNCPIVSTAVGDVQQVIHDTENCYIAGFDAHDIAEKISKVLASGQRTHGREKIAHLDSALIADRLIELYHQVLG